MNSKAAGIEFLKERLVSAENEQKKAQAAQAIAARLPQLDAEIQAIKLLLTTHAEGAGIDTPPRSIQSTPYSGQGLSVSTLVRRALAEAGKPQKTEQLLAFLASHGKPTSHATLRSTIYQQKGKIFRSISPGVYALMDQ
jgi:hypothetical protein